MESTDLSLDIANTLLALPIVLAFPALRGVLFPQKADTQEPPAVRRMDSFDHAKGLAILAVILVHVSLLYPISPSDTSLRQVLNFLNNVSRFCIPFFLISSGALLKPFPVHVSALLDWYGRKLRRIYVPYLLCVAVIAVVQQLSFISFLRLLITGTAAVPYYFVIILLQLYVLYPALVPVRNSRWLLPVLFALSLFSLSTGFGKAVFDIPLCTPYIYFFAWGLHQGPGALAVPPRLRILASSLICLLYLLGSLLFPGRYHNIQLLYGVAAFSFFPVCDALLGKASLIKASLGAAGRNSLWIFLLHFSVLKLVVSLTFPAADLPLIYIPFLFVVTAFLSWAAAALINVAANSLPGGRR